MSCDSPQWVLGDALDDALTAGELTAETIVDAVEGVLSDGFEPDEIEQALRDWFDDVEGIADRWVLAEALDLLDLGEVLR